MRRPVLARYWEQRLETQPFAMFSTVASEIFRSYLESKRKSHLLDALRANQETVRNFASLLVEATEITAELTWQEYSELAGAELDQIPSLRNDETALRAAVERMIQLDRGHIAQLEVLGALRDTFAALPSSHTGLINAVRNPDVGLAPINAALERSRALEALFDRLVSANRPSASIQLPESAMAKVIGADEVAETTVRTILSESR